MEVAVVVEVEVVHHLHHRLEAQVVTMNLGKILVQITLIRPLFKVAISPTMKKKQKTKTVAHLFRIPQAKVDLQEQEQKDKSKLQKMSIQFITTKKDKRLRKQIKK